MNELGMAPMAKDPRCGMDVDPRAAADKDLVVDYKERAYYFCGKGCLLDFRDDPGKFFDPSYVPHMEPAPSRCPRELLLA